MYLNSLNLAKALVTCAQTFLLRYALCLCSLTVEVYSTSLVLL